MHFDAVDIGNITRMLNKKDATSWMNTESQYSKPYTLDEAIWQSYTDPTLYQIILAMTPKIWVKIWKKIRSFNSLLSTFLNQKWFIPGSEPNFNNWHKA